jgi:glycine betaine/proline transport system permease protein
MNSFFLHLSIADWVNDVVQSFVTQYGDSFHNFSIALLRYLLVPLEGALRATPPWLILLAVGAITWNATRRIGIAGFFVLLLYAIGCFGLWDKLMETLALMLVATVLSVALGVPLGIFTSRSAWLRRILLPVLDIMQTLPSFVYLIPVLMLFGLGKVPAILATIIYALPPLIRLTDLGIRHGCGRSRARVWHDALAVAHERAVAARAPQHHGRHQPDDDDGAVDGGDRLDDRRARTWRGCACRYSDA